MNKEYIKLRVLSRIIAAVFTLYPPGKYSYFLQPENCRGTVAGEYVKSVFFSINSFGSMKNV